MTERPDWRTMDLRERDCLLIEFCQRDMSAAKIANLFTGCTRNSVIGAIHRAKARGVPVKLRGQPMPPRPPKPKNYSLTAKRKRTPPVIPPAPVVQVPVRVREPEIILPDLPPVLLKDLPAGRCKWPVSEFHARLHLFCGQPQAPDSVYCAAHTSMPTTPLCIGPRRNASERTA
jgi:hypothetical protein